MSLKILEFSFQQGDQGSGGQGQGRFLMLCKLLQHFIATPLICRLALLSFLFEDSLLLHNPVGSNLRLLDLLNPLAVLSPPWPLTLLLTWAVSSSRLASCSFKSPCSLPISSALLQPPLQLVSSALSSLAACLG